MSRFNKTPKQLVGLAIAVILLIVITAAFFLRQGPPDTENSDSSAPASSSSGSISLENDLSSSSIPLDNSSAYTPQNTLATLKASPAYQNARTDLPYAELFRNSDSHKGQYVRYSGKVVQVLGEPGDWNLRVNITKEVIGTYESWDDTVYVFSYSPERVIEKDIIEFTAMVNGTITYESALGGPITIPSLSIYEHALVGRSDY